MTLFRDFRASLHERAFWAYAVWLDIITHYRRTRLGPIWMLVPPLVYMLGLGFLYAHIMGKDPAKFIPHLGFGTMLWRLAVRAITDSAGVFASHQPFIMDGRTRYTDFVLRAFAKSFLYFAVGFVEILIIIAFVPSISALGMMSLAVTLPVFILNVLWISVVVALLGARFPDIKETIGTVLIFGFLVTPILWDASMVPPDTLRGTVMRLNPFFHLIEFVRAPVLGATVEVSTYCVIGFMTVFGWIVSTLLYKRYARFVPLWI